MLASWVLVYELFRLHRNRWQAIGLPDLAVLAAANVAAIPLAIVASVPTGEPIGLRLAVVPAVFTQVLVGAAWLSARWFVERRRSAGGTTQRRRVFVFDSGCEGRALAEIFQSRPELGVEVAGFVDPDREKRFTTLGMTPVLGTPLDLGWMNRLHSVRELLIARPCSAEKLRELAEHAKRAGLEVRLLPPLADWLAMPASGPSTLAEAAAAAGSGREAFESSVALARRLAPGQKAREERPTANSSDRCQRQPDRSQRQPDRLAGGR